MANEELRKTLRLTDGGPLLLPDCGDMVMVAVRYKNEELGFCVRPGHADGELTAPLLKAVALLKELANG
jgi:hypothetical protein